MKSNQKYDITALAVATAAIKSTHSLQMFGLDCCLTEQEDCPLALVWRVVCQASTKGNRKSLECAMIRAQVTQTALVGNAVKSVQRGAEKAVNNPEPAAGAYLYPRACWDNRLRGTRSSCDPAPCPNSFGTCIFWSLQTRTGAKVLLRVEDCTCAYSVAFSENHWKDQGWGILTEIGTRCG